jgi:hypothetical protein
VKFTLGDTRLPRAPIHGGFMTMASDGSAVQAACRKVRDDALARGDQALTYRLLGAARPLPAALRGKCSVISRPGSLDVMAQVGRMDSAEAEMLEIVRALRAAAVAEERLKLIAGPKEDGEDSLISSN